MNTEPDEYNCACPDGYSGKNCEIGTTINQVQNPAFYGTEIRDESKCSPTASFQPSTPVCPTLAPTEGRATKSRQALSVSVRQAGQGRRVLKVTFQRRSTCSVCSHATEKRLFFLMFFMYVFLFNSSFTLCAHVFELSYIQVWAKLPYIL